MLVISSREATNSLLFHDFLFSVLARLGSVILAVLSCVSTGSISLLFLDKNAETSLEFDIIYVPDSFRTAFLYIQALMTV